MTPQRRYLMMAAVLLITATSPPLSAQATRTLAKPDAELKEPFSTIASIRELPDGRVLVIDSRENTLSVANLTTGAVAPVGTQGSGPGEWRRPTTLYPLPGDSTLVQDPANGRFLVIDPNAKPARVLVPVGGTGGTLRATDGRGLLYYQTSALRVTADGPVSADSIAVVRYDYVAVRHDTIAFARVARAPVNVNASGGVRAVSAVSSPYVPSDDWAVLADGRVVIARASDYHIEIMESPTRRVAGPPVPFPNIPVTEDDKAAWRASINALRPTFVGGPPGGAVPPNVQIPEPEWQATKPAFTRGATVVAPNGEIWVQRNRPFADKTPTADVFDQQGKLKGKVVFPNGSAIVGFGARSVYLTRTDADGLQYLQKFELR